MKTTTRFFTLAAAVSATVAAIGATGFAYAQAGTATPGPQGGGMGMQQQGKGMHGGKHGEMGAGMGRGMHGAGQRGDPAAHLAATKTELKITAAQEPAWQAFETVVRQQAEARQALRASMQAKMKDPAAAASVDHAAQREAMQQLRDKHLAERDQARQTLYAVLSSEQKVLADQRLGAGRGKGGPRRAG